MKLVNIDKEKCRQDGLCAADCPVGIIHFKPGNYPELVPSGEAVCLRCGHCVAVCPHGAVDHANVPLDECQLIDSALAVSRAQAEQFLRSRRSIRQFEKRPVEPEVIERLIEVASCAPTASNAQPVEWRVINDAERLHDLTGRVIDWIRSLLDESRSGVVPYYPLLVKAWDAGVDSILRSAPCLVVAMAPAQARHGMVDLTLALAYLDLAAPLFGLGTCWAGLLQGALLSNPELKQAIGIPPDTPFHYPMMIGAPAVRYHRLPKRKTPKISWG